MRARCVALALVALCYSFALSADDHKQPPFSQITVNENSHAGGQINKHALNRCVSYLLHEMKLDDKEPPSIVVLHLSKADADADNRRSSGIYRVSRRPARYQIKIIDEPTSRAYATLMEVALEDNFNLQLDDDSRTRIVRYATAKMQYLVDASELRGMRFSSPAFDADLRSRHTSNNPLLLPPTDSRVDRRNHRGAR